MFDLLIVHADILTMCDDSPFISDGCIAVKDGKLAYVGSLSPAEPALRIIDATGKIALPGLVNAHTHGAMTMMRGYADDCPLQKWLTEKVFPVEARLPPQAVAASARVGFAEMIRTGTTSITDMYFHQTAVAQAVLETGLRASLGNALAGGGEFSAEDDSRVQDTRRLISEFHHAAGDLLRADVCVHSEYVSTPAIRRFAAELAAEHGLRLHLHVSETRSEHEDCIARTGLTPVALLEQEGILDLPVLAAHCVWVTEEDMEIMRRHGTSALHCPTSNLKLGSGVARISEMRRRSVNVALGTDGVCSNNSHDLFDEIRLAALLQKGQALDPTALSAYDAIRMATAGGAAAQGREDQIGRLQTGMMADLILVETQSAGMQPWFRPDSALAYAAHGSDVALTMVQGRILYENGSFTTIDIDRAISDLHKYAMPFLVP